MEIGERPWGRYEVILESSGYKVKKIVVNPWENYLFNLMNIAQNIGL